MIPLGACNGPCNSSAAKAEEYFATHPSSGTTSTKKSTGSGHVEQISDHVTVSGSNKNASSMQAAWASVIKEMGHKPKNDAEEFRYWRIVCSTTIGVCPPQLYGTLGIAGGSPYSPDLFMHGAVSITAAGIVRNLKDLQSLRGVSFEEFDAMAKDAGFTANPMKPTSATGGWGVRYSIEGSPGVQFMYEKGDMSMAEGDVHQGPYVKLQASKKLMRGRAYDYRVPAEGNPNPGSGDTHPLPDAVEAFLDGAIGAEGPVDVAPPAEIEIPEGAIGAP
jgi:hypothetical protein